MAKILRPDEQLILSRGATIDPSLVARSAEGTRAIGAEVTRAGRAFAAQDNSLAMAKQTAKLVDQQSRQYFKNTESAHQTGLLSSKLAEATDDFIGQRDQRFSQMTDDKGNPTFPTLHKDIESIGNSVLSTKLKDINDPAVKERFQSDFSQFLSNQQISAMNTARGQQLEYSNKAMNEGLQALMQQSQADVPENASTYEAQGLKLIDEAALSGIIDPEDKDAVASEFSTELRKSTVEKAISTDTEKAKIMLANPENLGLSEETTTKLIGQLVAKERSDEIQLKKAAALEEREIEDKRGVLAESVRKRIETDAIREDELLSLEEDLNPTAYKALKREFISASKKRSKENKQMSDISRKLSEGKSIRDVSPSSIDKHFNMLSSSAEFELGRELNLEEKAEIANTYKGRLRGYSKELNSSLISSNPTRAADAVNAYTYLRDSKSKALEGNHFTNKARSIAELSELYAERAGMSAEDSIDKARDVILNTTDELKKARKSEFRQFKDFKSNKLLETAADDLDAENFFGLNYDITFDSATTYKTLVQSFYRDTGDLDAAKKIAKAKMDETHGTSTINGSETYTFAPIEKTYSEVVDLIGIDGLRNVFEQDMSIANPELDVKNARLVADTLTRGNFINFTDENGDSVKQEFVSYQVVTDKFVEGVPIEVPVVDAQGRIQRWFPDTNKILEDEKQKSLDEARAAREEAFESEERQFEAPQTFETGKEQELQEKSSSDFSLGSLLDRL